MRIIEDNNMHEQLKICGPYTLSVCLITESYFNCNFCVILNWGEAKHHSPHLTCLQESERSGHICSTIHQL